MKLFQEMFLTPSSENRLYLPLMVPSGGCNVNIGDIGTLF